MYTDKNEPLNASSLGGTCGEVNMQSKAGIPSKVGGVHSSFVRLEDYASYLENQLSELEQVLDPVLSGGDAKDKDAGSVNAIHTSPVAGRIDRIADRIYAIKQKIQSICDRIDL